ncbi:MAG TPA: nucleoside monophosphate kinase [Verrucomicrobiales bacterium]|nr:nucleoside monophosphate kinase [Verrucomicrobiales bacterium]
MIRPEDRFLTFLIIGAPGSGKGTQGRILGSIPRFYHCSCGDVFRSLDTRTEIGQEFVHYSSQGLLVPDELTVRLWKEQIDNQVESHAFKPDIDYLVLDGIPRNVQQAEIIGNYVDVQQVYHLSCPDRTELARRLRKRAIKENRLDDAEDGVIERRLKTYESETKPMLDYYGEDLVTPIDASEPPVKVLLEILQHLTSLSSFQAIGV